MTKIVISTISEAGGKVNEDLINFTKNAFWVMDGATGLWDRSITGNNDAVWFVSEFNKYLERNIHNDASLQDIVRAGISEIKEKWEDILRSKNIADLPTYAEPSSSLILVRFDDEFKKMEYFLLGDSVLVFSIDGNYKIVQEDKLRMLDNIAKKEMSKYLNQGYSLAESRERIIPTLKKHRNMKNTEEGYWVLSFQEEAVKHAFTGTVDIEKEAYILAMTDGLEAIIAEYKVFPSYISMLEHLKLYKSFGEVYNTLRNIENMDSEGKLFPRFKKSDDASAIYFEVIKT